jgi:SAM-dependent methyltransferase
MSCCHHCRDAENHFDRRDARRRLARYRRRGPEGTTRLLIEALRPAVAPDTTVLDIGGGIGAVHHELLAAGAAGAVDIDASTAYLAAAREESARRGHGERATYRYGDFVALAPTVAPAAIVVLDRVVCCYPDMPALVGAAAARATRVIGLVYPRDAWWVRAGVWVGNLILALGRGAFRIFCHPTAAVDAELRRAGLAQRLRRTRGPWQIVVYERVAGPG